MRNLFLYIFSLIFLKFNFINSDIFIRSPRPLAQKFVDGKIKSSISKFGNIPYGYTMFGKLIYDKEVLENKFGKSKQGSVLESNFCSIEQVSTREILDVLNETFEIDEVPILLADRGDCTFVTKVRNMENIGAHVAIIADNTDEPVDSIVMSDDGKGSDVTIPAELISKNDADIIKKFMYNNPNMSIFVEIDFEIVSLFVLLIIILI